MTKFADQRWNSQYEKLVEFKRNKGHCMVLRRYEKDASLGLWVSNQRSYLHNNKLQADRKERLDKIGFAWKADGDHTFKPDDKLWHQQYEKLVKFQRNTGHCMVPYKYEQDVPLGHWVQMQRNLHNKNKLRLDRTGILDDIGFAYRRFKQPNDKLWYQQHQKLVEFKRKNGHCMVTKRSKEDKSLGAWVSTQRNLQNNNKLGMDRKKTLDALDFVWNVEEHEWHLQYKQMVAFKRQHQHCLGPFCLSLSIWVDIMRRKNADNTIRPERKKLLDELEFAWEVDTLGDLSSTTDVRGLVIGLLQTNGNRLAPSSQRNKEDSSLGNRLECPSTNKKLPSTHLAASTNQEGNATFSDRSVEKILVSMKKNRNRL